MFRSTMLVVACCWLAFVAGRWSTGSADSISADAITSLRDDGFVIYDRDGCEVEFVQFDGTGAVASYWTTEGKPHN